MVFKRQEVGQALEGKGFVRQEGRHVFFVYHTRERKLKTSVWTMMSHGNRGADISKSLSGKMAKQCRINKAEFKCLIDCSLSQENYEKLLVDRKVIVVPNAADQ